MHKPIYSIGMRKTEDNKLEIAIMPHIHSPNAHINIDGEEIDEVTVEPLANALKREVAKDENDSEAIRAKDAVRIKASEFSISKMLKHMNQIVKLPAGV